MTHRWQRRLQWLFRRNEAEQEMQDEFRFHLEMEMAAHVRKGLSKDDARRAAERDFGRLSQSREASRDVGGIGLIDAVRQDVGYAWRLLRRRPTFTASIALTLALGIGATTAILTLVDRVLLHPLPVASPGSLVAIYEALTEKARFEGASYPGFQGYRSASHTLSEVAGYGSLDVGLRAGDLSERTSAGLVSGNYFTTLGIRPAKGRLITPADEGAPGSSAVVVLADGLWRGRFASNPAIIGQTVLLGGNPFVVIGIAPPGFQGTDLASAFDLWIPITEVQRVGAGGLFSSKDVLTTEWFAWIRLIGRLKPGSSVASAQAELNVIYAKTHSDKPNPTFAVPSGPVRNPVTVMPASQAAALGERSDLLRFVTLLSVVVGLMLLIVCLNVANLMLARAAERSREFAMRQALGASRGRLIRQLFIENVLYALAGGVLALPMAKLILWGISAFSLPGGVAISRLPMGLDWRFASIDTAIALVAAIIFGLAPAWRGSRPAPRQLGTHGSAPTAPGRGRVRTLLVATQVAMSLVLLIGAALFLRSLRAGLTTNLGFDSRGIAALSIGLRQGGYTPATGAAFYHELLTELRQRPGMTTAALAIHVPLGPRKLRLPITAEGKTLIRDSIGMPGVNPVSDGYFRLLGLTAVQGRLLEPSDDETSLKVAVINQEAARRYWPDENPLGKRFQMVRGIGDWFTVVGVVRNTKYHSVSDGDIPYFYPSAFQTLNLGVLDEVNLVGAGTGASASTLRALREAVARRDRTLPIMNARVVGDQIDTVLMPQRFGSVLLTLFGAFALMVSAVGIYGVVAYTVSERTRELGIRSALGAQRQHLMGTVIHDATRALIIGTIAGLVLAFLATTLLARFLFGVTATDPLSFVAASLVLIATAFVASWLPARRAARLDPLQAIRM